MQYIESPQNHRMSERTNSLGQSDAESIRIGLSALLLEVRQLEQSIAGSRPTTGIFRQATVYNGRNRDTAWYAAIDSEWPELEQAFLTWLAPDNFDDQGKQRLRLSDLTRPILKNQGNNQ